LRVAIVGPIGTADAETAQREVPAGGNWHASAGRCASCPVRLGDRPRDILGVTPSERTSTFSPAPTESGHSQA